MVLDTGLGALVLLLKNLCFNVLTVLTVLVALSNELRRWKIAFHALEERQEQLGRAWRATLVVYLLLALLYAYLEHRPDSLIIDLLTSGLMVGAVYYLRNRPGGRAKAAPGDDEADEEELDRDGPAVRRPLDRPRRRYRRVPRTRRPEAEEYDDDE